MLTFNSTYSECTLQSLVPPTRVDRDKLLDKSDE